MILKEYVLSRVGVEDRQIESPRCSGYAEDRYVRDPVRVTFEKKVSVVGAGPHVYRPSFKLKLHDRRRKREGLSSGLPRMIVDTSSETFGGEYRPRPEYSIGARNQRTSVSLRVTVVPPASRRYR